MFYAPTRNSDTGTVTVGEPIMGRWLFWEA